MEFNTPILAYQGRKGEWDGSIPSVGVGDGSAIAGEYNEALSATFTQADRAQFVGTSGDEHHEQDVNCVEWHIVGTLNQRHPSR